MFAGSLSEVLDALNQVFIHNISVLFSILLSLKLKTPQQHAAATATLRRSCVTTQVANFQIGILEQSPNCLVSSDQGVLFLSVSFRCFFDQLRVNFHVSVSEERLSHGSPSPISSEEFWSSTRVTITFLATCFPKMTCSRKSASCSKLPHFKLIHSELLLSCWMRCFTFFLR